MYEHNALGYWSGLALCLTKIRSSRARCPATALIINIFFVCLFALTFCIHKKEIHVFSLVYIFYTLFLRAMTQ